MGDVTDALAGADTVLLLLLTLAMLLAAAALLVMAVSLGRAGRLMEAQVAAVQLLAADMQRAVAQMDEDVARPTALEKEQLLGALGELDADDLWRAARQAGIWVKEA